MPISAPLLRRSVQARPKCSHVTISLVESLSLSPGEHATIENLSTRQLSYLRDVVKTELAVSIVELEHQNLRLIFEANTQKAM